MMNGQGWRGLQAARHKTVAREHFERADAGPDDVTPELFLLATLSELKLYDKMKQPLDQMLSRQSGNDEIRSLHEAYMKQIAARQ